MLWNALVCMIMSQSRKTMLPLPCNTTVTRQHHGTTDATFYLKILGMTPHFRDMACDKQSYDLPWNNYSFPIEAINEEIFSCYSVVQIFITMLYYFQLFFFLKLPRKLQALPLAHFTKNFNYCLPSHLPSHWLFQSAMLSILSIRKSSDVTSESRGISWDPDRSQLTPLCLSREG